MNKSLIGGKVKFTHRRGDGSLVGEIEAEIREGDLITVEREYANGNKEERQVFPQNQGYQGVKSPWKEENKD
jgi:hypothetical protein